MSSSISPNIEYHEALGMMMWLMKHADYHGQWPLWSVDKDVVPALLHGQSKIYFDENRNPVGFATWAWLNEDAKKILINDEGDLQLSQWKGGNHLMFADFVAPWGHTKNILNDLRGNVFPRNRAFSLGRNKDGSIRKVYYWKGFEFKESITKEQHEIASLTGRNKKIQRVRPTKTSTRRIPPNGEP